MKEFNKTIGKKERISTLVEKYSDYLFSFAFYKTSNKEVAEDLVQDTFLACITAIERFDGRSDEKTWLVGILKNKINDFHRKNFKNPVVRGEDLNQRGDSENSFFDADGLWAKNQRPQIWDEDESNPVDNQEFNKVLQNCLKELPSRWNSAIQLKYFDERKTEKICQELEISVTNYWQILHRAKLQLRKCLEVYWFKKK